MAEEQEMFPELAQRVLAEHGLNPSSQRRRTGIDHVTMAKIIEGMQKPSLETVEKFARGFGLDVNRLRESAGFAPVAAYDGRAYYLEELGKLRAEFDPLPVEPQGWHEIQADTPPEVVDRRVMRLREDLLLRRGKKITQA